MLSADHFPQHSREERFDWLELMDRISRLKDHEIPLQRLLGVREGSPGLTHRGARGAPLAPGPGT